MENAVASLQRSIEFWEHVQEKVQEKVLAGDGEQPQATATQSKGAAQTRVNVAALQAEIRTRFMELAPHQALGQVLKSVGVYFGADYAAMHAGLGVHTLSEEWCRDEEVCDEAMRELVVDAMLAVTTTGRAKCSRLQRQDGEALCVLSAPMLDESMEPAGAMALMLRDCGRQRAVELLDVIDSIAGYMGLMISANMVRTPQDDKGFDPSIFSIKTSKASEHPIHVAFTMVNEISNGFGLDMVAIGFVHANRVRIVAISGMDEVRAANPGVLLIQSAMEACLDRREAVLFQGFLGDGAFEGDCRLHAQWSSALGGDAVASFPLLVQDEIIAIVSVRNALPKGLSNSLLEVLADTLRKFGPLLPLCRVASRSVTAAVLEEVIRLKQRVLQPGNRKAPLRWAIVGVVVLWLLFGSLTHSFTVPCRVQAAVRTVVSCPREGTLVDLFVRPGDRVRAGQLLAVLDDQDDVLARAEVKAELATLEARIDKALEEGEPGQIRIHKAQKRTMVSRLAVIEHNIQLAQVRAPQAGIILEGDLREKLGARIPIGEGLFTVAQQDRIAVVLQIPEHLIVDARKSQSVVFVSSARPDVRMKLEDLQFSPASVPEDGVNVFRAESKTVAPGSELAPGMEGFAYVEVGPRAVLWVLTHRITNWFRLRFWM